MSQGLRTKLQADYVGGFLRWNTTLMITLSYNQCLEKASVYKKELEIRDPLVERLGEIRGQDHDYINLLQNVENRTKFKHLPEDSELRLIKRQSSTPGYC